MDLKSIIEISTEALILTLVISAPPVIIATVFGLVISILQALTQVQDQTLPFAGKLFGVGVVLYFSVSWYGGLIYEYTNELFTTFYLSSDGF